MLVVSDWVPVATAGIAAAASLGGAWLSGSLTLERERKARHQQRKAEAYLELLAAMTLHFKAVNRQIFGGGPDDSELPPLPKPDPAKQARIDALVTAYASRRIKDELYPRWTGAVSDMIRFSANEDLPVSERKLQRFRAFNRSRTAREDIEVQVRHELETASVKQPTHWRRRTSTARK